MSWKALITWLNFVNSFSFFLCDFMSSNQVQNLAWLHTMDSERGEFKTDGTFHVDVCFELGGKTLNEGLHLYHITALPFLHFHSYFPDGP